MGGTSAMTTDGGAGGASEVPVGVEEGSPCAEDQALVCKGAAQQDRLVCDGGKWTATDACGKAENCEQTSGECQPIVEQCAGAEAGKRFCQDTDLVECGLDLVTTNVVDTCDKCVETGATAECVSMGCGDKVRESPEQCDDGNKDDTDDCTSACKVAHCGDTAVWDGHETCDDGNTTTELCEYGKKACLVCDASCQEVAGKAIYCGDAVWQKALEECDPEFDETANKCTQECVSTTWCLWPLPPLNPSISNYGTQTGVVIDNTTGLTWQAEADLTPRTWEEAKTYCRGLTLAVHSDWRLPTKIELMSIIDYSIPAPGPTISSRFTNATNDIFWTSSDSPGGNYAFYGMFSFGAIGEQQKTTKYKARCVHS